MAENCQGYTWGYGCPKADPDDKDSKHRCSVKGVHLMHKCACGFRRR